MVCVKFNSNMQKIHQHFTNLSNYLEKTILSMENFLSFSKDLESHSEFNSNVRNKMDILKNMKNKLSKYNIDQDRIIYIDYSEKLKKYDNQLKYSFTILNDFINSEKSETEYTIKIDNDLIFTGQIPSFDETAILVWKHERLVKNGDIRWGEIKICNEVLGFNDFNIYNLGIFGLPVNYEIHDAKNIMDKMVSIDISDVTDVNSKIYHCCEQTANNWVFYKNKYTILETYNYVDHLFDNKGECINRAKYLLKK